MAAHSQLLVHLSGWLAARELAPGDVNADVLQSFLLDRRAAGHVFLVSLRGMAPVLGYLRGLGVVPKPGLPTPVGPAEELLAEYRTYLRDERSLAPLSVDRYCTDARLFLLRLPPPLAASLQGLSAEQVTDFLVAEVAQRRTWAAKSLVTALRSLLRFLHVTGCIQRSLVTAVPSVAGWGLGTLPRAVGDAVQVAALLSSCDRTSLRGRRDYAIVMLLSRLGLRNGEVAHLRLDDIDWQSGQIMVRGKGNRHEAMPLPDDVGRAVVDYLVHGRPPGVTPLTTTTVAALRIWLTERGGTNTDPIFCTRTGHLLSRDAVEHLVTRHAATAARTLPALAAKHVSPHTLRHTAAMALLHAGVDLSVIALWLGHESTQSVQTYLHADMALKERALVRTKPDEAAPDRYHPPDTLLAFLTSL